MDTFSEPHFRDDDAAREYLEKLLWPEGPVCPHCGVVGHAYKTSRAGVYRCAEAECRKDFSVTMKTVMERSKIEQAFHLMCASKKGISAHQLHRTLGIGYEAAWFMCHRIREAMRNGGLDPLGGNGGVVEADETYYGKTEVHRVSPQRKGRPYKKGSRGPKDKRPIVALVERGGRVRTFHVAVADKVTVQKIVAITFTVRRGCTRTKVNCTAVWMSDLSPTKPCAIRLANMCAMTCTPTQPKATFQFSNAACAVCTSIAKKNICIAIWRNMTSVTITASGLATTMATVRRLL